MFRRSSRHITVILMAMLAGLAGGGCASTRITVTPPVKMAAVPEKPATTYRLEQATLKSQPATVWLPDGWQGRGFAERFTTLAEKRYPRLFSNSRNAIPIAVRIDLAVKAQSQATIAGAVLTFGIIGGIFPSFPWTTEWQVKIQIEDIREETILTTGFKTEDRGWFSLFSPFGLISIPGESDAPKVSSTESCPGVLPREHSQYAAECMIDLLAMELLKLNPAKLRTRPAAGVAEFPTLDAPPLPNF
jgi:hypothetical protein